MKFDKTNTTEYHTDIDITISDVYMVISQSASGSWTHESIETHDRLMLITKGSLKATIMDNTRIVKAPCILYVPRNTLYKSRSNSSTLDHICILYDCIEMPGQSFVPDYFFTPPSADRYIQLFEKCQAAYWPKTFGYKIKSKMIMYDLISRLCTEQLMTISNFRNHNVIKPAVKYINDHYETEQISIERLAEMCNVTTTHFSRLFKAMYGTTPVKYINTLRLDKATALITHTNLTVTEISDQCGFSDPSYFSKSFKKFYGQSPLNYKNEK